MIIIFSFFILIFFRKKVFLDFRSDPDPDKNDTDPQHFYQSVYWYICSIFIPFCLSIYLPMYPIYLSYPSIYISIYPSRTLEAAATGVSRRINQNQQHQYERFTLDDRVEIIEGTYLKWSIQGWGVGPHVFDTLEQDPTKMWGSRFGSW